MEHVTEELELEDIQIDDDMATTAELTERVKELEKHSARWLQPAVIFSTLTAIASIAYSYGMINSKIDRLIADTKELSQDFKQLSNKVSYIDGRLNNSKASTQPKEVLSELKNADAGTFAQSLPALGIIARQPAALVGPNAETLRAITGKLRLVDNRTPGYWPATMEFLRFSTAFFAPNAPPPNSKPSGFRGAPDATGRAVIQGFTIEIGNSYSFKGITFENCRLILKDAAIEFHDVVFINCVFEIPVTDQPGPQLKKFTQVLLASNLSTITIPGTL